MPVVAHKAGNLIICDINSLNKRIEIPLSAFVEGLQIVKLENSDQALVGENPARISENYLLVNGDRVLPVKLFERKTGKFVCNIGSIGQGPGEYRLIYDRQLDEENNRIYLLPWQAKDILVYDLQGKALPPIPVCFDVPKGKFRVDTRDSTVTVVTLPFTGAKAVVWSQTTDGRLLNAVVPGNLEVVPDFSNEVDASTYGDDFAFSIFTFSPRVDTLYHYERKTNRLMPAFTLDFKNREPVMHSYAELPDFYVGSIMRSVRKDQLSYVSEEESSYIVNRKTLRGSYFKLVNDFFGGMEIQYPSFCFTDGYYVRNVEPAILLAELEEVLEKNKDLPASKVNELTDLKNSITENDNNYILLGKLKQEGGDGLQKNAGNGGSFVIISQPEDPGKGQDNVPAPQNDGNSPSRPSLDSSSGDDEDGNRVYRGNENDMKQIKSTPHLPDANEYFRKNNRYADWDINDKRDVVIRGICEKDGTLSAIEVRKRSGVKELDDEAVRLMEDVILDPGISIKGKPLRCEFSIGLFFPPLAKGESPRNRGK
jgi:hypothetical protein